ncbi:MAG: class I SAM-dependent methyltransferase [Candidatus Cloacimonetes bacterium]|jgi:SAM-dependent methyltransferase|nr:class I SAM-dependent methyltransferase [Candidatus Cloacimonadota bacterium]
MQYDPIKDKAAALISIFPMLRKFFYAAMNMLLLRQRYVFREIRQYAKDDLKFYDAGAGFCQYSHYVLKHYPQARVFATDLKADYLSSFAHQTPERFSYQSADLQYFTPKYHYDMAIAIDILEHIEQDVSAIRNISKALKSGGIFIVSTPSDTDEAARFTGEHVRPGYNKAELESKLINCDFNILKSTYTYGRFGALSWRLMLKYPLQWLSKGKAFVIFLPFWYLGIYPISELLMRLDMSISKNSGTGILIVAKKI